MAVQLSTLKSKLSLILLTSLLSSCAGYPRLLNFPFDPGGRGLNSRASELNPQIADGYIVFVSDRNGSQDIYVYDAKNRRLIDLIGLNSLNVISSAPSISEDGRYVVFAASFKGQSSIYLYERETQQKRNLTENLQAEVRNPTISADGSTIAFEVGRDGQWDILVVDRSGKPLNIPGMSK
jgi:Tol biopolymer transport system component